MQIWTRAHSLAGNTPDERNRYVDFLRAISILVVVFGHWLMAAPQLTADGGLLGTNLLSAAPRTHFLTWILQVMPIFFLVGGYANGIAWRAANRDRLPYGAWLRARLRRLVLPVLPLLAAWAIFAGVILQTNVKPRLLQLASQAALVPVWFLATYLLVVSVAPLALRAWERWGWGSVVTMAVAAGLVDLISLGTGLTALGYLNYLFVWGAVHQMGFAWLDGRWGSTRRRLMAALSGLSVTILLVAAGPYPVAMVGLDTAGVNNSQPPKITLFTLALFQAGLVLALEDPARRALRRLRLWTATVAISGMIMTVYLWHMSAMILVIGTSLLFDGFGLRIPVNTGQWWLSRPLWIVLLLVVTIPLVAGFSRYERPRRDPRPAPASWRPVLAAIAASAGMAMLALYGIADADGLNGWALALPFLAALIGGIGGVRLYQRHIQA